MMPNNQLIISVRVERFILLTVRKTWSNILVLCCQLTEWVAKPSLNKENTAISKWVSYGSL
jgi:hypothetical protein